MAGAGSWNPYNDFKFNLTQKLINLSTDTIKVALYTSSSTLISATLAGPVYTTTNELTTANGYTAAGVTVAATVTGGGATATITLDTADATWTASGSGFTARAAVMYSDTSASKNAIAYMLLDSTPADVTVAAGNTLTINIVNVFTFT